MEIRELTAADIQELRELAIRIFRDTFSHNNTPENMDAYIAKDYNVEAFEREFREKDGRYFFISENGVTAGYLRVRYNSEVDHLLGSNNIELQRIYVSKEFHGRKVADQLMRLALDIARENGHEWIWLGVWEHNPRAQRFYEKWGFERFSQHEFVMGDDAQTDYLYRLKL